MGFEDEVEQSFGRPCRQCNGRLKRTYELTSSIVPRGTSFHVGNSRFRGEADMHDRVASCGRRELFCKAAVSRID